MRVKDTIEQSMCRLRTEEEDRAVKASVFVRAIREALLGPARKTLYID